MDGTWERLNAALRERLRVRSGRHPQFSSAGVVDSQSAKTTGVGCEARGYDGGKMLRGRKRHLLLVDTEGLVLEAKVHSAKVPDQDGIGLLLERVRDRLPRLSHLWVDTGYRGRGKEWAERALGLSVEVVHRSPKPTPEKVLFAWAREWHKEGRSVDLDQLLLRRGFEVLPRRRSCRDAGSRGKDLRLDLPQPEDEHEGLREAVRDRRSVCLRGYGAFDGQAVGP